MATAFQPPLEAPFPPRKRWTRQECARVAAVVDLDRYELIDGELLEKVGKNSPHMLAAQALYAWLLLAFRADRVSAEPSVDLHPSDDLHNELQPDLVALSRPLREIPGRPGPADLALVVEISDATLSFDLTKKRDLYARAGVPDYWVVDVKGRRVFVHREPANGAYRAISVHEAGDEIAPLAAAASRAAVRELLSL